MNHYERFILLTCKCYQSHKPIKAMKHRLYLIAFIAICLFSSIKATDTSFVFYFNEKDFSVLKSNGDSLNIISIKSPAIYLDETKPCIPLIGKSIVLENDVEIKNITTTFNKRLIHSDIILSNAPYPCPTDVTTLQKANKVKGYSPTTYPESNCLISNRISIGDLDAVNFLTTPYIYDALTNELFFIDSLRVDIEITKNESLIKENRIALNQSTTGIISEIFEDTDEILPQRVIEQNLSETYEYIIITNESLKDAFTPLAEWKRKKGVTSKIITIEEINERYFEPTLQMRIKSCITDMYESHFTQYVLLGGDIEIVPSYPCYVNSYVPAMEQGTYINHEFVYLDYYIENDIPADVYYSCLGTLDWDTNGDGRVGDPINDKIVDLVPITYVTRAPVQNIKETEIFVNRTIEYEQNPNFIKGLFHCGATLTDEVTGEALADLIFDQVINRKVVIGVTKLFDTYESDEPFSTESITNIFNSGYILASIFSHGNNVSWCIDNNGTAQSFFNTSNANKINNSGHTLITTMACETNHFDQNSTNQSDPCLSEALFRNPNSGIIGFIGSSRLGWFNGLVPSLDYSIAYEYNIYDRLFNSENYMHTALNLGTLIARTKASMLPYLSTDRHTTELLKQTSLYRWLHYSVNVLGDPEMPIFTTYPKSFQNSRTTINDNGELIVYTGSENARVCVSSKNDNEFYEVQNGSECIFKINGRFYDVWITEPNYIPKHYSVENLKLSSNAIYNNEDKVKLLISPNPASSITEVTIPLSSEDYKIEVSLTNTISGITHLYQIPRESNKIKIDISTLPKGLYVVNLLKDGIIDTDNTSHLIKQ